MTKPNFTRRQLLLLLGGLSLLPELAVALDDSPYTLYLRKNPLKEAECWEEAPDNLMRRIAKRGKLSMSGFLAEDAATVKLFFVKYRDTLQPAVDRCYPKAKQIRGSLNSLLCFIFDFMESVNHHRSYVTEDWIAGYGEYILASSFHDGDSALGYPLNLKISREDVASYGCLKAALFTDNGSAPANYDKYREELLQRLRTIEELAPELISGNLRIKILTFMENPDGVLNPEYRYP